MDYVAEIVAPTDSVDVCVVVVVKVADLVVDADSVEGFESESKRGTYSRMTFSAMTGISIYCLS